MMKSKRCPVFESWTAPLALICAIILVGLGSYIVSQVNSITTKINGISSDVNKVTTSLSSLEKNLSSQVFNETVQIVTGTECGESPIDDPCNIKFLVTTSTTPSDVNLQNITITAQSCREEPAPTSTVCSDACVSSGFCTGHLPSSVSGDNSRLQKAYCNNIDYNGCRGYCSTGLSTDCPELQISPGVNTSALNPTIGKQCALGVCQYYIFLGTTPMVFPIFGAMDWSFAESMGPGITSNLERFVGEDARVCMSLISDNEKKKKCMIPILVVQNLIVSCWFQFGCTTINKGSSFLDTSSVDINSVVNVLDLYSNNNNTNITNATIPGTRLLQDINDNNETVTYLQNAFNVYRNALYPAPPPARKK